MLPLLAAFRLVVAGVVVRALARVLEPGTALRRANLPALVGVRLLGMTLNQIGYTVGLDQICYTVGLDLTGGSNAALVAATAPVWGILLVLSRMS